jgi:hypothetical protein
MSNFKKIATSFCKAACSTEFRAFVEGVFLKGFRAGFAEGRRETLLRVESKGQSLMGSMTLIDNFIKECCVLIPGGRVSATVLFKRFLRYATTQSSEEAITQTQFGRILTARFNRKKSNGCVFYRGLILQSAQSHIETNATIIKNGDEEGIAIPAFEI